MLFTAPIFPLFFGIVYLLYRLSRHKAQNILLLAASYFFYAWWDWRFLSLIIASTAVDYLCAQRLGRGPPQKRWVALSVAVNLSILCTFKYLGWFVGEFVNALNWWGIQAEPVYLQLILPVGLSFYTFQSMAYTIDVYRGELRPIKKPLDFALFVGFFPQLVAGPIERAKNLLPQIQKPRELDPQQLAEGGWLILWGFFKKLVIADNLAFLVEQVFDEGAPNSGMHVLIGMYAFTWQIYCDFSGYTDIARGIAKLMGFELSINFRLPFFAKSPREIWRRWHISLSQWLRDYLYIPLGGNRKGPKRNAINLMLTMLLGGLWHGANWTFVIWGAWHGAALAIQRVLPSPKKALKGIAGVLAIVATFHFLAYGFLIFRAHDMAQVGELTRVVFTDLVTRPSDVYPLIQLLVLISLPLFLEIAQFIKGDDLDLVLRWPRPIQACCVVFCVASIVILGATTGKTFIYFQF